MIAYDVATKILDTNISSTQHHWPDLWYYIYCFAQSGEAFMVKGNKHTHTHTHIHTHRAAAAAINQFERLLSILGYLESNKTR